MTIKTRGVSTLAAFSLIFMFFIGINFAHADLVSNKKSVIENVKRLSSVAGKHKLVIEREFLDFVTRFKDVSNKKELLSELDFSQDYFSFIASSVNQMKISPSAKKALSSSLAKTLGAIKLAKTRVSELEPVGVALEREALSAVSNPLVRPIEASTIEASNKNEIEVDKADADMAQETVAAAIQKKVGAQTSAASGEASVDSVSKVFFGGVAFLFAIGLVTGLSTWARRRKSAQVKMGQAQATTSGPGHNDSSNKNKISMSVYKDVPNPIICVNDKGMIIWSNSKANEQLMLTKGSSFFLDQECQNDEESGDLLYQSDAGADFWLTSKSIGFRGEAGKMLIFTPVSYFQGNLSYKTVEGSLDITGALKRALTKMNHLFSEGGVPLFIEKKAETGLVDEKESDVFAKALFLVYHLAKDVRNPRVNLVVDKEMGKICLQMDIRGLKVGEIDFDKELVYEGATATIGDLWSEVELSLSKRQARITCQDSQEFGGLKLKLLMNETRAVLGNSRPAMTV